MIALDTGGLAVALRNCRRASWELRTAARLKRERHDGSRRSRSSRVFIVQGAGGASLSCAPRGVGG